MPPWERLPVVKTPLRPEDAVPSGNLPKSSTTIIAGHWPRKPSHEIESPNGGRQ